MKKVIAFLTVVALAFSFAACGNNEDNSQVTIVTDSSELIANYFGEGEKQVLRTLAYSNAKILSDIFILSHLPADQAKKIQIDGVNYAPVIKNEYINTYSELINLLNANYTADTVKTMLGNPAIYIEKDGVLYYNTDYTSGYFTGEKPYHYIWDDIEISITRKTEDAIEFVAHIKDPYGNPSGFPMKAVTENSEWKLADFYYVNK